MTRSRWAPALLVPACAALLLLPGSADSAGRNADPGAPPAAAGSDVRGTRPDASVGIRVPALEPLRGDIPWQETPDYRAPFPVSLDSEPNYLSITTVTLLPGENLILDIPGDATVLHADGEVVRRGPGRVAYLAPEDPGLYALAVRRSAPGGDGAGEVMEEVRINVFVAHPARAVRGGVLEGYRIGSYREQPLRGDPAYLPPRGFVEVRPEDHDIRVSPHFTLGEFLCKQAGNPKLVVLSTPLLLKLELILEAVNHAGIRAGGLVVMSGYRTPFYNRAIGNTTDYSRHLWGDAADIYVDEDGDGEMDDLNGDGQRTVADARLLARIVEGLADDGGHEYPVGGLAAYRRNPSHGPFVHVDARGSRARW